MQTDFGLASAKAKEKEKGEDMLFQVEQMIPTKRGTLFENALESASPPLVKPKRNKISVKEADFERDYSKQE